jgi:hypothetical protein
MEMWPAGLTSPVVYYQLRIRQLEFQIKAVQREGAAAWRAASVAGSRPCDLRQRRGLLALSVKLPLTASGVNAAESAQYVRTLEMRSAQSATVQPAATAQPAAAASPPPMPQQPTKRSRLADVPPPLSMRPGSAMQQRSEAAAHLVARSYASASSVGSVVIQLQPSSCRSGGMSGGSTPSSSSSSRSSPLRWLHRFGASVRSLVGTPMSVST